MRESRQRLRKLIAASAIRQLLTHRQLVSFQMPLNNDSSTQRQQRREKIFSSQRANKFFPPVRFVRSAITRPHAPVN
jgi:hypothetical protein